LSVDERIVERSARNGGQAAGAAIAREDRLMNVSFDRRGEPAVGLALQSQRNLAWERILPQQLTDLHVVVSGRQPELESRGPARGSPGQCARSSWPCHDSSPSG
jgi:hypothetical protein